MVNRKTTRKERQIALEAKKARALKAKNERIRVSVKDAEKRALVAGLFDKGDIDAACKAAREATENEANLSWYERQAAADAKIIQFQIDAIEREQQDGFNPDNILQAGLAAKAVLQRDGSKINRSLLDEARAAGIACLEQARNEDRRLRGQGEDVNAAWVLEEASNQPDNISLGAGNDENKPPSTPHIGSLNHNDLNQAGAASNAPLPPSNSGSNKFTTPALTRQDSLAHQDSLTQEEHDAQSESLESALKATQKSKEYLCAMANYQILINENMKANDELEMELLRMKRDHALTPVRPLLRMKRDHAQSEYLESALKATQKSKEYLGAMAKYQILINENTKANDELEMELLRMKRDHALIPVRPKERKAPPKHN